LCRYCHAPHNTSETALTGAMPLWDRTDITPGNFTPYGNPNGTMQATASIAGVSAGCLSCHDGATALDSLLGETSTAATMTLAFSGTTAVVGTELGNDHPIGVLVTAGDTQIDSVANIIADGLTLYADKVECASCHDVHDNAFTYFLRNDPVNDSLCDACHLK
jgi:predicted CXXCH cytochrome family protein